jgi:hypothetical protein
MLLVVLTVIFFAEEWVEESMVVYGVGALSRSKDMKFVCSIWI